MACGSGHHQPSVEIVLIGIGNEYSSDDGVGHYIAKELKTKNLPGTHVELLSGEAASLIEAWRGKESAIVFDAVRSGALAGKIYRFEAHSQSVPSMLFNCSSSHSLGVSEAVELSRRLNFLPPCIIIYGIEGKNFGQGVGLSPEVKNSARDVVELVMMEILGEDQ
jgi:hydrogenase maturation protease